ncbi:MAG: hypothetical protein A2Z88_05140 [Omnitrophica WOR_2 bacterium GWA2_47_8]|nr:MAG: hypothetical protein A2Z88_05140 [Omnitrophica WOR_2 bacterium GWA2_47_8]
MRFFHLGLTFLFLFLSAHFTFAQEIKTDHFILHYGKALSDADAQKVLSRAEYYYRNIADLIGSAGYSKFWTWDKRVLITVYDDPEAFTKETGQPPWSNGYVQFDSRVDLTKSIATFRQSENFSDAILPHEISHLLLHDFLGNTAGIPLWFDEGLAQLQEKDKLPVAKTIMKALVSKQRHIPLSSLMPMDIRKEKDAATIKIFYAQSLSVVDFLINKYGKVYFRDLCLALKNGKTFESALISAYPGILGSLSDLERQWMQSVK